VSQNVTATVEEIVDPNEVKTAFHLDVSAPQTILTSEFRASYRH